MGDMEECRQRKRRLVKSLRECVSLVCTHRLGWVHWKDREVVGISEKVFGDIDR